LSEDDKALYTPIIDEILAASDLEKVSAKRIRKYISDKVGYDISHQKDAVNDLIMARFDKFMDAPNGASEPVHQNGTKPGSPHGSAQASPTTSRKRSPDDDSESPQLRDTPPKKKPKKQQSVEEDDAAYAARLQAELNAASRPRSTRGAGTQKKRAAAPKKKEKKRKSANRVKDDDDSDVASSGAERKEKKKRTGGFHKPMGLSPALAEFLGETQLPRTECVSRLWQYIKQHDLQLPSDKRQIVCDDAMRAVFKQDRMNMFTMNKILAQNLYNLE
ncbi:SWIB-domain-containing protein, partial [Westerdykella ornata]